MWMASFNPQIFCQPSILLLKYSTHMINAPESFASTTAYILPHCNEAQYANMWRQVGISHFMLVTDKVIHFSNITCTISLLNNFHFPFLQVWVLWYQGSKYDISAKTLINISRGCGFAFVVCNYVSKIRKFKQVGATYWYHSYSISSNNLQISDFPLH